MIPRRLRKEISLLPSHKKFIGLGSLILFVSVFLPWYQEKDDYFGNETFLGISGPMYLAGLTVLAISATILLLTFFEIQRKKLPRLPFHEWVFHLLAGSLSLYLLILTNTVYLHPKFGVNLVTKSIGFGVIVAVTGAVLLIIGALQERKSSDPVLYALHSDSLHDEKDDADGKLEPLIHLPRKARPVEPLKKEPTIEDKEKEYENLRIEL
ncbi:hypothetical protein HZA41_03010 [Candidatus Peregrinibacteria bacterium]|nr:hypothetical protein [Candidatus Peregrinibacteria bacterium]